MVHSLTRLLTHVMTAKRDLKRVYYTSRNEDAKLDAKELVAATITLQKLLEDLITKRRTIRVAKKILEDRKAELSLQRWAIGFPRRAKDFLVKSKKLEQQHLRKYQQVLVEYVNGISNELVKWIEDIETLRGMPRPPRG
jgi:DNA-directed RNA polymerase subunit F